MGEHREDGMRLRILLAVTMLTGTAGLAGWAALGGGQALEAAAPWTAAPAARAERSESLLVVARAPAEPPAPLLAPPPVPAHFGWDASLLSPHMLVLPPPTPATPETQAARVPAPPPRPEAKNPPPPSAVSAVRKDTPKPDRYDGKLTVAQVAHIKQRLRLTAEQEEQWKPVEAILIDLARKQARSGAKLTLSPDASMNLYWAAGPLMMSLREDQRNEARNLARAMGLESVASLI